MESEHGSRSSKHFSKDADTSKKKDDTLAPLISLVDSDHDSESETDIEITVSRKASGSAKKSISSNSVSSSSSDSLADDFFLMDAKMLKKSITPTAASPKANGDAQTPVTDDKNDKLSDITCKSKEPDNESQFVPSSQLSDVREESLQSVSPVQSPPIQVMERSGDFDPDRIPASVFASTPSTAVDWSVASNDSLFSIQIGNNSFSGDQFLMMGGDMHKTEELYNSGELYTSGELNKSGELIRSGRPPLSPVRKLSSIKTSNVGKKSEETGVADETMKDSPKENGVDQVVEQVPQLEGTGNSSSVNRHSNGSGTSCQSFAFPILTDNGRSDSGVGYFKQQDTQPTDYEKSPKAKKASNNCWYCCSLPSWSCSLCWSYSSCGSCSSCWLCSSCWSCRCRYCC